MPTVNPKGIVDIFPSKVLYQDSVRLCNADKFSIEFIHFALDVYELKLRIEKLNTFSNTIFWIPNVKTTDNSGISLVEEKIISLSPYYRAFFISNKYRCLQWMMTLFLLFKTIFKTPSVLLSPPGKTHWIRSLGTVAFIRWASVSTIHVNQIFHYFKYSLKIWCNFFTGKQKKKPPQASYILNNVDYCECFRYI